MKKSLALALCALSSVAFANTEQKSAEPAKAAAPAEAAQNVAQNNPPRVLFAVYDVSDSKNPKVLEKREFSRSNAKHRLCWTAQNINPIAANLTIEQFTTPASIDFVDAQGTKAQKSKDGKTHIFTGRAVTLQGGIVEKCWTFNKKYPVGDYTLTLRVNSMEFPPMPFKIVK